jgi:hypothetical protein
MKSSKHWLWTLVDLSISILFIYSALAKINSFNVFLANFSRIPIVYSTGTWFLAYALIIIEILIAIIILFEKSKSIGYLISCFLLIVFTMFLVSKAFEMNSEQCMCGGLLESLTLPEHIVFNLFFLSLVLFRLLCTPNTGQI